MFRPQRVYIKENDNTAIDFDLFTDIEPLKNSTAMLPTAPILDSQAESMGASIGSSFEVDHFLNQFYKNKKTVHKARAILTYLQKNIDGSVLRFGTNGGIFFKGGLLPDADLTRVLENLTAKKSNTLVNGEYYLITQLTSAPTAITSLINSQKLKLCNIQVAYKNKGPPMSQTTPSSRPTTAVLPPGPLAQHTQVEVKTAHPNIYKVNVKSKAQNMIQKTPTAISKLKPNISTVQKRFNAKNSPAWYKVL